jgi:peptide/nickel transport system substrate-binding protein
MSATWTQRGRGRRSSRSIAAVLAVGLAMTAFLTAVTSRGGDRAVAAEESTLTLPADTAISTFNPFLAYYDGELDILGNIYPTLTSLDENGEPVPYYAQSWETSDDQLTWTFHLKPGLTWSDGEPLTAEDAAWTFNLIMTDDVAATANGSLVSNFKSVEAQDDDTLVITTKKPQANMLYVSVPVSGIPIVPQHVWESHVSDLKSYKNFDFPVVGYGPWELVGNKTNQYATLEANKDFFMGAPGFDRLISQYYSNSDAAVAALNSGSLDRLGGLNTNQFKTLENKSELTTYQTQSNGWTAVEVNSGAKTRSGKPMGTGNPILADETVRQAIALGINRPELVEKVLGGNGISGAAYLPPGYPQWYWEPSEDQALNFDPDRANQMLDEAGYTKGSDGIRTDPDTGEKFEFRLGIHSDDSYDAAIAPYLEEWMKDIGIGLKIEPMSFDQLNNNLAKGDWDLLMDGWSTGPDPTYLLSIQTCATLPLDDGTSGNTDAFYCNPEYDKLFDKQITQFDAAERADTLHQMQEILYQANADIILYYKNGLSAIRSDQVKNYLFGEPNADGFYPLQASFINWRSAEPATSSGGNSSDDGGSNAVVWILVVVAVLVVVGVGVTLLRRRSADERE